MLSEFFYELFSDIPRQGPGSNEYTRKAYMSLPNLALQPNILDVGCGSGMQTLELARISTGEITALDNYQPFLDDLRKRARSEGLANKINILNGSMFELPFARGTFDLIWSEGAIFIIGFEKGLRAWKAFIRQGGYLVVSELSWIKPDAPDEVRTYLEGQYPAIKNIAQNTEIVRQADYDEVASFVMPESGWWDIFYNPLQRRINQLRRKYAHNLQASMVLDDGQLEIDMYKKYSPYYGYVFYLMQTK